MSRAAPQSRKVLVSGRELLDQLYGVLVERIGAVADVIDIKLILEALLEEYFFGGQLEDTVYDQLSAYGVPTDVIVRTQSSILGSIGRQLELAIGQIRPCNHYGFYITRAGDVEITETPPVPLFRPKRMTKDPKSHGNHHSDPRNLATV